MDDAPRSLELDPVSQLEVLVRPVLTSRQAVDVTIPRNARVPQNGGPLPKGAVPDLSVDGTIEIERLTDVVYVGRPVFGQPNSQVSLFKLEPDGQGAAPEINATGTVSGGTVQFKFQDDVKNVGTGTIMKAGDDAIVSIRARRVTDSRCLQFYRQNMRLKRVSK